MATDKTTQDKELTVEERLKALYELQTILSKIDRIKIIRGELPLEVQDLEDEIAGLETRIQNYKDEVNNLNQGIREQHKAIDEAAALIDKYTQQQDNVRNNREFDFLSKEIEYQHLNIELAEKKINDFTRQIEQKHADVDVAANHLADRQHILEEKKGELNEIVSETKQDEEKLREQAKKLEVKFDDERLLSAFKRIRKNARNGLGIVYIQRNACGGCFNRIPPQRQMEIKMHKKVIVCEYCGRIMIDPELAGIAPEVEATLKK
ncbi:MAG: C4-type zinc ribbon domain-containing protein [Bacteroidales bacterium]|nr:C4-type zinc ribbon domain-containing protein [Bacteroidales bacterium]MEE0907180.1 C4-type zinc ribbon domain-containing protein [Muribaculaceae bacterium]